MIESIFLLMRKIVSPATEFPVGWTSLMIVNLFFGGILTFLISLVLEYLSVLVLASHGKPVFFTADRSSDELLNEYFGRIFR
jgi:polyisoprenyl-phosphate glycosyltransferase